MPYDVTSDISHLRATVSRLTAALERVERRHRRIKTAAAAALLAAIGFLLGSHEIPPAQAEATAPAGPRDPAAMAEAREELFKRLSPDQRREFERFEHDADWVSQYFMLYRDRLDPGAIVAVMLGRMALSVEAVPEMRAEMQVMNAKMNALPVMASEIQGMNAKMGVMAAGMDSTMGRAGRMLPTMPWNW
jgi:hypothetical protein